jgi:hypothetical protein
MDSQSIQFLKASLCGRAGKKYTALQNLVRVLMFSPTLVWLLQVMFFVCVSADTGPPQLIRIRGLNSIC